VLRRVTPKPLKLSTSHPPFSKFLKKNFVVNTIKCFAKVAKDCSSMRFVIKIFSNFIHDFYKRVGDGVSFSKSLLTFTKYRVGLKEVT
jgi:hypothetical protein